MKLNALHTLLAVAASVTVSSVASAATWDVTTDFNAPNSTWSYGTTTVSNNAGWTATSLDVNNYVFNTDTYSSPTFGGGTWVGNGSTWAKSETGNTEWGSGEPLAWVSLLSAHGQDNPWIFTDLGVYLQPYAIGVQGANYGITGDATVIRWTAPETGTFNLTGGLRDLNAGGLVDQIIKTAADGSRTVVHSIDGAPLAVNAADDLSGSVSMQAGETLDLIAYQSPVYLRTYGHVDLQISSVPEPASLALFGIGAIAVLRRRRAV